jgi:hypothetical protein
MFRISETGCKSRTNIDKVASEKLQVPNFKENPSSRDQQSWRYKFQNSKRRYKLQG